MGDWRLVVSFAALVQIFHAWLVLRVVYSNIRDAFALIFANKRWCCLTEIAPTRCIFAQLWDVLMDAQASGRYCFSNCHYLEWLVMSNQGMAPMQVGLSDVYLVTCFDVKSVQLVRWCGLLTCCLFS